MKYFVTLLLFLVHFSHCIADSTSVLEYYSDDDVPTDIVSEYKQISIELTNSTESTKSVLTQVKKVRELKLYLLDSLVRIDSLLPILQKISIQNLYIYANYSFTIPNFQKIDVLVFTIKAPNFTISNNSKLPMVKAASIIEYGKSAKPCPIFAESTAEHLMFMKYDDSNSLENRKTEFAKKKIEVIKPKNIEIKVAEEVIGEKYDPNKQIVEQNIQPDEKDEFLSSITMKKKVSSITISKIAQKGLSLKGFLADSLVLIGYEPKTFDLAQLSPVSKFRFFGWNQYNSLVCTEKNTTLTTLEINGTSLKSFPNELHNVENLQELHIHNSNLDDTNVDFSSFKKLGLLYITNSKLTQTQIEELQKNCGAKGIICIVK